MDFFKGLIDRYLGDVLRTTVASVFLLWLIKVDYFELGSLPILSISAFERIGIFVIVAFILGKLSNRIGWLLASCIFWLCFQSSKRTMIGEFFEELKFGGTFGRAARLEPKTATLATQVVIYMDKYPAVSKEYERAQNDLTFWLTVLGISLLGTLLPATGIHISIWALLISISLLLSLIDRTRAIKIWRHCCYLMDKEK